MIPVFDCLHPISSPELSIAPRDPSRPVVLDEWLDRVIPQHLARMDADNVTAACIRASVAYRRTEGLNATRRQNDFIAAYRDRAGPRLRAAFGVAQPLDAEDSLPEIDRCAKELGLTGIGFHTRFQGVSTESYWVLRYIERILDLGMVPSICGMSETSEEALWKVAHVAKTFPESIITVGCAFSGWENVSEAFSVAEECPNIVWNTALAYDYDMIESFIEVIGSKRVIFGTDLHHPAPPKWTPALQTDRFVRKGRMLPPMRVSHLKDQLLAASLPEDQKHDILWGNAMRIYNLEDHYQVAAE